MGVLGAVRILPEIVWQLLHGERPSGAPDRLTLLDTTKLPMSRGGWVLLGERPEEEIALGLVGKFWRPVIEYAQVDAATFKEFAKPGFAKTVYALGTRPTADGVLDGQQPHGLPRRQPVQRVAGGRDRVDRERVATGGLQEARGAGQRRDPEPVEAVPRRDGGVGAAGQEQPQRTAQVRRGQHPRQARCLRLDTRAALHCQLTIVEPSHG